MNAFQVLGLALSLTAAGPVGAAPPLRVGVAETDITPPLAFPMAGYYHERHATGIHDPLKARAFVFAQGDTQAALVVCDLIGIAVDLSTEVRRQVSARTGIPAGHIAISGTHSHTAPDYTKDLYQYLARDAAARAKAANVYAPKLIGHIVEAVVRAHERLRPATLAAGSAVQRTPVSFNRRFVMKDGSVRTWMRLDQPDVLRAAGPIDPEIGMVLVRAADGGMPLGLLSNFALHLDTVGGTRWSADYPFYIQEAVRKKLGPDVVSMFATGCCGDINHVDPVRKERNPTDVIGNALAETMLAALPDRPLAEPRLRVHRAVVSAPLQEVSPEQVARARPLVLAARAGKPGEFYQLVAAHKAIMLDHFWNRQPTVNTADTITWGLSRTWAGVGGRLPLDVQVIALSDDCAVVCLPGEIFVDLGLAIKRASPFRTTLVVELANAVETIYVPTRVAYAGGGYEVVNAALAPGGGEMLAEAAVRLLREAATSRPAPERRP